MMVTPISKSALAALTILAAFAIPSASAAPLTDADRAFLEKRIIAHWEITGPGQIAAARARGIDILEDHPDPRLRIFTILVSPSELEALLADGYKITVETYDWYASYSQKSAGAFGGFRTYDQIV
ncbi:MAG TPA: hypothetical protein VLB27_12440, partial [candidate division Zixibacteria bacterium]|nr:hypothetical protein [candidate division Zixibacteria bacterium]